MVENLRGLLCIREINTERMGNDRIAKRDYMGEWVGSRLVGRPRRR